MKAGITELYLGYNPGLEGYANPSSYITKLSEISRISFEKNNKPCAYNDGERINELVLLPEKNVEVVNYENTEVY